MYGIRKRILAIGIDFDDTITAAPEMFEEIIGIIKKHRHYVVIVTARDEGDYDDMLVEFEKIVDAVQFTNGRAKQDEAEGIDIWIDDFPLHITHNFNEGVFEAGEKVGKWVRR